MKFVESYFKNLAEARFVTIITAAFLLSLLFFELMGNLYQSWYPYSEFESSENITIRNIAIGFQSTILFFFLIRMVLVCFTKSKIIWISQGFWLLHWLTIFSYFYITTEVYKCCSDREHFPSFFLTMFNGVSLWFFAYMVFSPIKQLIFVIVSFFCRK